MSLGQLFIFGLCGLVGAGLVWLIFALANARADTSRPISWGTGGLQC